MLNWRLSLPSLRRCRSDKTDRDPMHEFCFQSAEAAFHRCIVPAISLPAHGLNHPRRAEDLAVIGGGVLAAAIGMVDPAGRRLLPLGGHGPGRDGSFRPHVGRDCERVRKILIFQSPESEVEIYGGAQRALWEQFWNLPESAKFVLLIGHNPNSA